MGRNWDFGETCKNSASYSSFKEWVDVSENRYNISRVYAGIRGNVCIKVVSHGNIACVNRTSNVLQFKVFSMGHYHTL